MQSINAERSGGGAPVAPVAPRAVEAVLVVAAGGRRYAFELGSVAEIHGVRDAAAASAVRGASVVRNGVRVPVFRLDDGPDAAYADDAGALIVLDLPDRLAAVAVDAVCEVRIAQERLSAPVREPAEGLTASVAWVAVWDGGEAPVLDVAGWLQGCEREAQLPAQAAAGCAAAGGNSSSRGGCRN